MCSARLFFVDSIPEKRYKKKRDIKRVSEKMKKIDKNSHFPKNFLVLFRFKGSTVHSCLVNARDEKNAFRVATNRLCRMFPDSVFTHARIEEVYKNTTKSICIDTKKGLF